MNTKGIFEIEGLSGKRKLEGEVRIGGAKNSALKAMAASILFASPVVLENVPENEDIATMSEILTKLGAAIKRDGDGMEIDSSGVNSSDIDPELGKSMRASVVLTGPLLARFGKATFPAPGGCVIGARPIDLFLEGYRAMGAKVDLDSEKCIYSIAASPSLKPAEIFLDLQAVGPTETLLMASVLTRGITVLKNCAMEPEIANVAEWLNECGAKISGLYTPTITVNGRGGNLLTGKRPFRTIPDRNEAGSFLFLAGLLGRDITLTHCRPDHLESVINLLKRSGVSVSASKDSLNVKQGSPSLQAFNIRTHEYPGFPTDLQAPAATFLTQASGESTVLETIFEGRFKYVADLVKMGAAITLMNPREILIKGPTRLKQLPDDEELSAHDIRAGFAIVMAALAAEGKFKVNTIHHIDRGYEKLEGKLSQIGAKIKRV